MEIQEEEKQTVWSPLTNSHILSHIFNFLPVKELCLCRLVCKDWSHEATLVTRKHVKINLSGADIRRIHGFNRLSAYNYNPNEFPFSNFVISLCNRMSISSQEDRLGLVVTETIPHEVRTLFHIFGHCMRLLNLSINDFEMVLESLANVKLLVKSLENLQDLELFGQSSVGLENKTLNYVDFKEYFQNLGSLKLVDFFGEFDSTCSEKLVGHVHENHLHVVKCHQRFTLQFVSPVLNLCRTTKQLTIDTFNCKKQCSLTQSVLHALLEDEEGNKTTLPRLTILNLSTIVNQVDLRQLLEKRDHLKLIEVKYFQVPFSSKCDINSAVSNLRKSLMKRHFKDYCKVLSVDTEINIHDTVVI